MIEQLAVLTVTSPSSSSVQYRSIELMSSPTVVRRCNRCHRGLLDCVCVCVCVFA